MKKIRAAAWEIQGGPQKGVRAMNKRSELVYGL